ncbi:MAG TPA: acyltransferase [Flavobacteriales bacterium]|nr:acyltransferase [Flavobacteriales bacterium]
MAQQNHIRVLDALRGLAALSVVLFHFGVAILPSLLPNPMTEILRPGRMGLHVFFVISGFILPYAMHASGYTWSKLGAFMARRWVRLGPPAYIAACGMILYYLVSIWSIGRPVSGFDFPGFSAGAILRNLTFTVGLTDPPGTDSGGEWYNFVYWSLAVEFEFYLLLGLLFPLLMDQRRKWLSPVIMAGLLFISQWHSLAFFRYTVYFLLGILVFQRRAHFLGNVQLIVSAVICCAFGIARGYTPETLTSLAAAGVILAAPTRIPRPFIWLGTISYSLYILHPPVGYFLDSIGRRITDIHSYPIGKIVLVLLYTAIAVGLSWVFHRVVENPFLELSKRVGHGKRGMRHAPDARPTEVVP